jgi:hypothetical protein
MPNARIPFYDIRDWWFSNQDLRSIFNVDSIGYIPCFPGAQQPEAPYPHIVYQIERNISRKEWWQVKDYIFMDIRCKDISQAYNAVNIMIDMASQGALSAREINKWLVDQDRAVDFEYHCIEFDKMGDIEAAMEQGGDFGVPVGFTVDFSPRSGRLISSD